MVMSSSHGISVDTASCDQHVSHMCLACMYSSDFYFDNRLRSAAIQLYSSMFGRLTPSCVPKVSGCGYTLCKRGKGGRGGVNVINCIVCLICVLLQLGMVIDLKEEGTCSNFAAPITVSCAHTVCHCVMWCFCDCG